MDKEAREENFNSQNVNLTIQYIDTKGAAENCLKVVFSDSSFFYVRYQFYCEKKLCLDKEVSQSLYYEIEYENDMLLCTRKALDLLARRDHSRYELKLKLLKRYFPKDTIEDVLIYLDEKSYLDDEKFAIKRIKYQIKRKPHSRMQLKADLYKKGIDRNLADKCIKSLVSEEDEYKTLISLCRNYKNRGIITEREKLIIKLSSKGYTYNLIRKAIDRGNYEEE